MLHDYFNFENDLGYILIQDPTIIQDSRVNVICKNFGLFCDREKCELWMNEKCKKYFRQTVLKFLWHIVEMHFNEDYFTTAVCMKKREILSHWKNISWNQL